MAKKKVDYSEQLDNDLNHIKSMAGPPDPKDLLSTGSTLLNLACSGIPNGGIAKGKYYLFVGDSNSGKTFLCLTMFAEACKNKRFSEHRLIYDSVEDGAMMDMTKFFGSHVSEKLEAPRMVDGEPMFSNTVEDFYDNLDDAVKVGKPFIYVLDSMDALLTEDSEEKYQEQKKARRENKEVSGSYGDGKAKSNSQLLRRFINPLKATGSILIIIVQTRDNIGFGAQFNPKTRGGGRALKFYATLEIWSSVTGQIKKKVKGKDRQIGITSKVHIKKNRIQGKDRFVDVSILHSYGVDDIGSNIDYLVEEGVFTSNKGRIVAEEFDFTGKRDDFIAYIEENNLEKDLQMMVGDVWKDIETKCESRRKSRYE